VSAAAPAAATKTQPPTAEENVDEEKLCRSPVAGVVIKVNVAAGQSIQANDLIVVLESHEDGDERYGSRSRKGKGCSGVAG